MKIVWKSKKIIIPTAVLMITVIGGVAAATVLFTHTFPSVTVPGVTPLVATTCPGATLVLGSAPPATATGFVLFTCSVGASGPAPTFNTGTSAVAVSSTGGLPVGYTDLYAIPCGVVVGTCSPGLASGCAGITGAVVLLSSNPGPSPPLTLTVSTGTGLAAAVTYTYCADFRNTATTSLTLATFTVSWQQ